MTALKGLSRTDIRNGFSRILKESPKWAIIRVDRDPTFYSLKTTYFAKKGILLQQRRSAHHMIYFENIVRSIKRKFIQNMRLNHEGKPWTYGRLVKALQAACLSYNQTTNSKNFKPADVNDSRFDPELRRRLYGPQAKLRRFEDIYTEQLRLRKKYNTPVKPKKGTTPEYELHKSDLVYVEFELDRVDLIAGRKAYRVQRKKNYEVSYVNTFDRPFLYRLRDIRTQEDLAGYYYQNELSKVLDPYSDIEQVLKQERAKDGWVMILVKFKWLDSSFNQWLPEK